MKTKAIMKIESYSAKDGTLLLSVDNAGAKVVMKELLDLCQNKYSGYVKAELSLPYRNRTLAENSRWWAMCTEYANYCGSTKDEVARGVKWRACEEGLWELVDVPFSKTGRKEPKSTTESDVKEMAILMEVLERIASEDGYIFEK